jgi:serine/threonine protein kinase
MEIGEVYGKYRLIERIAIGGMAEVYKAMAMGEAGFEKPVAIKRLHRQFGEDADLVGMLQDEARLCSQLNHGNICQVLDLGRVGDTYYIAMEYVNGKDLFNLLRKAARIQRKLPLPGALFIACEMLAGLDYAHRKRGRDGQLLHIIHRDISPQNVLITYDGEVKIIDFGIAKARTSTHRTQAGVIKGKFRYMSPEQARGEPIDHRTDIFATGVVLYEMITGKPHAAGATDREILIKIQRGRFDRLSQLVLGLPAELEKIAHRALTLSPEERWSSARSMRKALLNFMRTNGLTFTRDDLAEYVRALFTDPTGQGTQVDQVEPLDSEDLQLTAPPDAGVDPFEPRTPAPDSDPFAPGLAPVVTVGLSAPKPPPSEPLPPAAGQPSAPEEAPAATVALREDRRPAGLPAGPPANQPPRPAPTESRQDPPAYNAAADAQASLAPDPHAQAATTVSAATQGRGRPSAVVAFARFAIFLALLGLIGVGVTTRTSCTSSSPACGRWPSSARAASTAASRCTSWPPWRSTAAPGGRASSWAARTCR